MSCGLSARVTSLRPEPIVSSDGRGGRGAVGRGLEVALESSDGVMKVGVEEPAHDELEAQEEADVAKPLPTPDMPTPSELLDLCVTHTPYQSWCRHCREGRG